MANEQLKTLLKRHAILSILEDEELEQLIEEMTMVSYSMGENIVKEGEPGNCAYLIYSGRARVFRPGSDGKPITLGTLSRGDLFGEFSIIKQDVRNASVRASGDVVLFRIDRDDFQKLLNENPELRPLFETYMQDIAVINFLRLTTFMVGIPTKQVVSLLQQLETVSFQAGETIIQEGDSGDRIYIIKSGEVNAVKNLDGEDKLLRYLNEGDYFGERALMLDEPRAASVIATQDTECYSLSRDSFNKLIESAPKVREQMLEQIEQYHLDLELEQRFGIKPSPKVDRPQTEDITAERGEKEELSFLGKPRRFRKYPWIRQHDETDCGAASLAMISRYYGIRISVGRLRDLANIGREGANMYSLAAAAEKIGYTTRAVRADYSHLLDSDLPVIAHWKGYHYIVLYEVKADKVLVGDPAVGLIKMKREEFEEGWTQRILLLTPTSRLEEVEEEKTTFKRFIPLLKPYQFLLLEVFIASLILNLLGLASPIFTQTIVDKVLVHQDVNMLNIMLGGMILVGAFQMLTILLRQYLLIHISTKLNLTMVSDLFKQITKLAMRYFHTRKIGDVLTRFGDLVSVQRIMTETVISIVLDVLMIGVYLSLMLYYNAKLTGVSLIFIPLFTLLTIIFTPILKRNDQKMFEKQAVSQSKLIESINSIQTIKASVAEMSTRWQYENLAVQEANTGFHGAKLGMAMSTISRTLNILSSTFLLWYGAHLVIDGKLTVGQLMAFQSLIGMVTAPIMGLIGVWQTLQDAMLSLQRLNDIYDAQPEEQPQQQLIQLPRLQGQIKFENVSFRYNLDDKNILANINLEIQPGQTVAIVGRSGSGKTTLVNLLMRFYPPTEGRILVDGYDITSVSVDSLRNQIGMVLQDTDIFSGTIRENISTTDPNASLDRVIAAAKLANADDFISAFPMGYDTVIGEVGINLSGGQKQRIAIARALLNEPRIIIFDEATSSLDTESEKAIQQNMEAILKNRAAIVISHRRSTIQNADMIIVLDEGRIVEQGDYRELMKQKGLYYYLNSQQLTMR